MEYKLSKLFDECAFKGNWTTIKNVDFKFKEHNDILEIYFMGSYQLSDWFFNFLFKKKLYKQFRVHKGFYKEYSIIRSIVLDKCYSKEYKRIVIIGYSLGGALCQLALEDILYHFPKLDVIGYAFETPRCLKVPNEYKYMWNNLLTTECNYDLVCHVPPKIFGFNDLGTKIKISGDTTIIQNKLPKCIKSHFAECVLDGLHKI